LPRAAAYYAEAAAPPGTAGDGQQVRAEAGEAVGHFRGRAGPHGGEGDDARHADDDSEGRQYRAEQVRADAPHGNPHYFDEAQPPRPLQAGPFRASAPRSVVDARAHPRSGTGGVASAADCPSLSIIPSRRTTVRSVCSAMSGSWVTMSIVEPSRCSSCSSSMIS